MKLTQSAPKLSITLFKMMVQYVLVAVVYVGWTWDHSLGLSRRGALRAALALSLSSAHRATVRCLTWHLQQTTINTLETSHTNSPPVFGHILQPDTCWVVYNHVSALHMGRDIWRSALHLAQTFLPTIGKIGSTDKTIHQYLRTKLLQYNISTKAWFYWTPVITLGENAFWWGNT